MRRIRSITSAAVVAALVLLAAGCGDQSEDGEATDVDAATTDPTAETTAAPTPSPTTASGAGQADGPAAFVECMAGQGIEIPSLDLDAGAELTLGDLLASVDTSDPATQAALVGCQGALDSAMGGQLTELLTGGTIDDALIEFSQCLRDEGYDVADLTVPGVLAGALGANPGPDPRGDTGSLAPLLAAATALDGTDVATLDAIDGCAAVVEQSLAQLGLS